MKNTPITMDKANPAFLVSILKERVEEIIISDVTMAFVEYNDGISEQVNGYVPTKPFEVIKKLVKDKSISAYRTLTKQPFYEDTVFWFHAQSDPVERSVSLHGKNLHKFRRIFLEFHGNQNVQIKYNDTNVSVDTTVFDGIIMSRIGDELEFRGEDLMGKTLPTDVGFTIQRQARPETP